LNSGLKIGESMTKIKLEAGPFIVPMPVVLVGANVNGKANFMPAAFLGIVNYKPPVIACGLSPAHHTCTGISATKSFSINLPSAERVEATDWCGLESGKKTDKSKVFDTFPGDETGAPMIRECRLTAECRLQRTEPLAVDTVYFGEIVGVYADEEALTAGAPDWKKIAPLLFTFPDKGYWKLGDYVAEAWCVGKRFRK
jgi:flavin reductase (DIM6/NTAB) family NADH-FMN oxidoreductase RutF